MRKRLAILGTMLLMMFGVVTAAPAQAAFGGQMVNRDGTLCVQISAYYSGANRSRFVCPGGGGYGDVNAIYVPFNHRITYVMWTGGALRGQFTTSFTIYLLDNQIVEVLDVPLR